MQVHSLHFNLQRENTYKLIIVDAYLGEKLLRILTEKLSKYFSSLARNVRTFDLLHYECRVQSTPSL